MQIHFHLIILHVFGPITNKIKYHRVSFKAEKIFQVPVNTNSVCKKVSTNNEIKI